MLSRMGSFNPFCQCITVTLLGPFLSFLAIQMEMVAYCEEEEQPQLVYTWVLQVGNLHKRRFKTWTQLCL